MPAIVAGRCLDVLAANSIAQCASRAGFASRPELPGAGACWSRLPSARLYVDWDEASPTPWWWRLR